jgi:hypothetical protein
VLFCMGNGSRPPRRRRLAGKSFESIADREHGLAALQVDLS